MTRRLRVLPQTHCRYAHDLQFTFNSGYRFSIVFSFFETCVIPDSVPFSERDRVISFLEAFHG